MLSKNTEHNNKDLRSFMCLYPPMIQATMVNLEGYYCLTIESSKQLFKNLDEIWQDTVFGWELSLKFQFFTYFNRKDVLLTGSIALSSNSKDFQPERMFHWPNLQDYGLWQLVHWVLPRSNKTNLPNPVAAFSKVLLKILEVLQESKKTLKNINQTNNYKNVKVNYWIRGM